MNLYIKYNEIATLVKEKTTRKIKISYVSDNTCRVEMVLSTQIPFFNKTVSKTMSVLIQDVLFSENILSFRYVAGVAITLLMPLITKFVPTDFLEEGIIEFLDSCQVRVHIDKINSLKKVLQYINITALSFEDDALIVDFTLSNNMLIYNAN